MRFTKMQGAGNDFIVIDQQKEGLREEMLAGLAVRLCRRKISLGADGVMFVDKARGEGDFSMRFFNQDGSEGEMCGNGARCICRYGIENGLCQRADGSVLVETRAGLVSGRRQENGYFTVRLNDPSVLLPEVVLTGTEPALTCAYTELGQPGIPHAVVFLPGLSVREGDDLETVAARMREAGAARAREASAQDCPEGQEGTAKLLDDGKEINAEGLRALGRRIRYFPGFPKGANVNFYNIRDDGSVDLLTFERGVEDFTLACGTGTGGTAAVLALTKQIPETGTVFHMMGGTLQIRLTVTDAGGSRSVKDIFLTGPAVTIARGELTAEASANLPRI